MNTMHYIRNMKTNSGHDHIKELLESKYLQFNTPDFIGTDPIQIPHGFNKKEDIEIAAFLTACLAWGSRPQIIKNAKWLMTLMDNAPHDFVTHSEKSQLRKLEKFYYRTWKSEDILFFVESLRNIYNLHGGLEKVFSAIYEESLSVKESIIGFRKIFMQAPHMKRSEKHISDVENGSAAKRLNLFLMWMIRSDSVGVHFGLWNKIPPSALYIPLDVHVARIARQLMLLIRKQNDWKAVEELMIVLRSFDPSDPVRFDFALFGLGLEEKYQHRL